MKTRTTVMLLSALLLFSGSSRGEWRLQVHHGPHVDQFILSEVDSLTFFDDTIPPGFVVVPAGTFVMGDGLAYCGADQREVTLTRDFYLGRYEVTNAEYLAAVQWAYDNGYVTANTDNLYDNLDGSNVILLRMYDEDSEIQFDGAGNFYLREAVSAAAQQAYPGGYDPTNHPVINMTWYGAVRYCDWLSLQEGRPRAYQHVGDWQCNDGDPYGAIGYRLPTDAEWEYTAQYANEWTYPWGEEEPNCDIVNFYDIYSEPAHYCVGWTAPVGSYPPAPQLPFYDLGGNANEYCNDWHVCNLGTDPVVDPPGPPSTGYREIRNGGWSNGKNDLRTARRGGSAPSNWWLNTGFRVARTVNP